MELTVRPMEGTEYLYCYSQSQQIEQITGCIGHLRADMDTSGTGFYSSWDDHNPQLKTDAFILQLQNVIQVLRFEQEYDNMLQDRVSLARYCQKRKDALLPYTQQEYGFRADTKDYAFMLRLNPQKGVYNLYCYCYERPWLDRHLEQAKQGIRFITPSYDEKFRIRDGDSIRVITSGGQQQNLSCRYIDETHFEAGSIRGTNVYHICEFAEIMEKTGCRQVIPLRASLPKLCYTIHPNTGEIVTIEKGADAFRPVLVKKMEPDVAEAYCWMKNYELGITDTQKDAMLAGFQLGWDSPKADPDFSRTKQDRGRDDR